MRLGQLRFLAVGAMLFTGSAWGRDINVYVGAMKAAPDSKYCAQRLASFRLQRIDNGFAIEPEATLATRRACAERSQYFVHEASGSLRLLGGETARSSEWILQTRLHMDYWLHDKFSLFGRLDLATRRYDGGVINDFPINSQIGNRRRLYGVGMEYYFADGWGLRTEWRKVRFTPVLGSGQQESRYLLGVSYRF